MKIVNKASFLAALLLFSNELCHAQNTLNKTESSIVADEVYFRDHSKIPNYIRFNSDHQISLEVFFPWFSKTYHLNSSFGWELISSEPDQLGYIHYRYRQTYDGLPVESSMYILHVKAGKVVSANGMLYTEINAVQNLGITESAAFQKALDYIKAEKYIWDEPYIYGDSSDKHRLPVAELLYAAPYNDTAKLIFSKVYRFDIYAIAPLKRAYVYVDAASGERIWERNRLMTADTNVTAYTAYSGHKRITVDRYGSNLYRLRESGRGKGIETYNLQHSVDYSTPPFIDFEDTDTLWNNVNADKDQYATDAHYAAEKTYDFYKRKFNRNSLDNAGFKIKMLMHYYKNYSNAAWTGNEIVIGDGDTNANITPLSAVDVCGHELTHGVTEFTSGLYPVLEPGALNESFSDILGTAIEWYADSLNFNWNLGTKVGTTFRLLDPRGSYYPATYKDKHWYTGNDWAVWVHLNCTVQNCWYYLLCTGDTGTNANGWHYNVKKIGMDKATAIAYRTNAFYLTPTSTFKDSRYYSIKAATDLYGECSKEVIAVTAAWHAVGIGNEWNFTQAYSADQDIEVFTRGSVHNNALKIYIAKGCTGSASDTVKSFLFNTKGTTNTADITKAQIWYTGEDPQFNDSNLFGSVNAPSGNFSIKGQRVLPNGDNYFWLTYDIKPSSAIGDTVDAQCLGIDISNRRSYPAPASPSGFHKIGYCTPPVSLYTPSYCWIKNVAIDSINNSSGASARCYTDYTDLKTIKRQGETVNYKITLANANQYVNIWMDINNDSYFDSTEWLVQNQFPADYYYENGWDYKGFVQGTFNVPLSTPLGSHQIRVQADVNKITDYTSCKMLTYSETEDYTMIVTPAIPMKYLFSTTTQKTDHILKGTVNNIIARIEIQTEGILSAKAAKTFNVNVHGTTDTADITNLRLWFTGHDPDFSTAKSYGSVIVHPGNSLLSFYDSLTLLNGINYFWLTTDVRPDAIFRNFVDAEFISVKLSTVNYYPLISAPKGKRRISYCFPEPVRDPCGYVSINHVTLDSINNHSGCSNVSYTDFDTLSTTVEQGDLIHYNVSVEGRYGYYVNVWIDINNDLIFDSSEWFVQNAVPLFNVYSGFFILPKTTVTGYHTVRIRTGLLFMDGNSACMKSDYGETEDYRIYVIPPRPMKVISVITTQNNLSIEKNSYSNQIIGVKVLTQGSGKKLKMGSFRFNFKGTTDTMDIRNARLWYTDSTPDFKPVKQLGSAVVKPGYANFNITDTLSLKTGINYFWLSCDVAATAPPGHVIDAECTSLLLDSVYYPNISAPPGNREIGYCSPHGGTHNIYNYWVPDTIGIVNVELNTIHNASWVPQSAKEFYQDYHYLKTNLEKGKTYGLTITPGSTALFVPSATIAWIDWNRNTVFDSTEVVGYNINHNSKITFPISVGSKIGVGDYRLRIMSGLNEYIVLDSCHFDPCMGITPAGFFDISECEDYTIHVILPTPEIRPNVKTSLCLGARQVFTTDYDSSYNYFWYKNNVLLDSGKGHPHDSLKLTPVVPGSFNISVRTVAYNEQTISMVTPVVVHPLPLAPGITLIHDTLFATPVNGVVYQWQYDGAPVTGSTGYFYKPNKKGTYTVQYTDSNYCRSDTSKHFFWNFSSVTDMPLSGFNIQVYPNPSVGLFRVVCEYNQLPAIQHIRITDLLGNILVEETIHNTGSDVFRYTVDLSKFPAGVYLMFIDAGSKMNTGPVKLLKE